MYFKGTFAPEELERKGYKGGELGDSEHSVYDLFPDVELHRFVNPGNTPYVALYERCRDGMLEVASTEEHNVEALVDRAVFEKCVPCMSPIMRADLYGRAVSTKNKLKKYLEDAAHEHTSIIRNRMISAALSALCVALDEEMDCVDALELFTHIAKSVTEVTCYSLYETKIGDTTKFCREENEACVHKCIEYIKKRKKHYDKAKEL